MRYQNLKEKKEKNRFDIDDNYICQLINADACTIKCIFNFNFTTYMRVFSGMERYLRVIYGFFNQYKDIIYRYIDFGFLLLKIILWLILEK